MAFNIRLLDKLSYDDAEPLLFGYINDAIQVFVNSDLGQAQVEADPEGGEWIGTFIEMAYQYGEMTLPKMTKADAQVVMEQILPAKITLADRRETEHAIAELVAFWTFLKQEYNLRSAGAIAKYLKSIEGKFTDWMFDPNRGGMAKRFILQGLEAGYDMQSQEGMEAFQKVYNDRIANAPSARLDPFGGMLSGSKPKNGAPKNVLPKNVLPKQGTPSNIVDLRGLGSSQLEAMPAPPEDIRQMLEVLGVDIPPEGTPVDPMLFMGQMLNALEEMDEDDMERLGKIEWEEGEEAEVSPSAVPVSPMAAMLRQLDDEPAALSEKQEALLQTTQITEAGPGTILQDFQMLLDAIGSKGLPVSATRHQFALKLLRELNDKLVNPIEIDLKRPAQKSFPPLNGLYLLLRATGLVRIEASGKKYRMVMNSEIYDAWQQLNPTERYFTLLEAWLIRAHPELLGDERSPLNDGSCSLKAWSKLAAKPKLTYANYNEQDKLSYWPGFHNLSLMQMFGFLQLTPGQAQKGKGWRFKAVETSPLGQAIMPLLQAATAAAEMMFESESNPTLPFNDFQPTLQPYFPEWQETLAVPSDQFREGRYIFKVSMVHHSAWRKIAIAAEATLEDLSAWILDAFEFGDYEHLDAFTYANPIGRKVEVMHPMAFDGELFTHQIKIGQLPIHIGAVMEYVFDFGHNWQFKVQLETIEPLEALESSQLAIQPTVKISASRKPQISPPQLSEPETAESLGEILESHGQAPPQYADSEDW